ncbi:MAG TPA: pesticin C-terminus-like muramidase [Ferruginibacter sp.]|nr:pesticin C-terminus-like muramidase [Ferruginibacter sp.]
MQLQLSKNAINKAIMAFEVSWSPESGFAVYNRKYRKPIVPDPVNTSSGVTIGIGYDCGQYSANKIKLDWQSVLPLYMVNALADTAGLKKQQAVKKLPSLSMVDVPIEAALQVFYHTTIFEFAKKAAAIYPDLFKLNPVEQSVIVGLVYNRGASLDGDRRREMRSLVAAIQRNDEKGIADLIRAMIRLWPDTPGLRRRRIAEAALIDEPNTPVAEADLLTIII